MESISAKCRTRKPDSNTKSVTNTKCYQLLNPAYWLLTSLFHLPSSILCPNTFFLFSSRYSFIINSSFPLSTLTSKGVILRILQHAVLPFITEIATLYHCLIYFLKNCCDKLKFFKTVLHFYIPGTPSTTWYIVGAQYMSKRWMK